MIFVLDKEILHFAKAMWTQMLDMRIGCAT